MIEMSKKVMVKIDTAALSKAIVDKFGTQKACYEATGLTKNILSKALRNGEINKDNLAAINAALGLRADAFSKRTKKNAETKADKTKPCEPDEPNGSQDNQTQGDTGTDTGSSNVFFDQNGVMLETIRCEQMSFLDELDDDDDGVVRLSPDNKAKFKKVASILDDMDLQTYVARCIDRDLQRMKASVTEAI